MADDNEYNNSDEGALNNPTPHDAVAWNNHNINLVNKAKSILDDMDDGEPKLTFVQKLMIDRCQELSIAYKTVNSIGSRDRQKFDTRALIEETHRYERYLGYLIGEEEKVRQALYNKEKYGVHTLVQAKLQVSNKANFAEIIQALFLSKEIFDRGNEVSQRKLVEVFNTIFELDYSNFSKTIGEVYRRKEKASFLTRLITLLVSDNDEKNR